MSIPRYRNSLIVAHWLMALLILGLIGLGWYMVEIPPKTPARGYFYNLHKAFGLIAMGVIVLFALLRALQRPPPLPDSMQSWEKTAAHWAHMLTYGLLLVVPLSGYAEANLNPYGIKFFGLHLKPWGPEMAGLSAALKTVHVYSANAFAGLLGIHILAALKHALINRDGVLRRMLPGR
ncbi:cytochrome b [Sinimarinibacterium sp. NLF-5-8]|uniref:cytochrome b n=1 Tax=Sinimarinibacterium sp. NLF-5-8 TaxID=2698684 RepID=UPI00137BE698|nr:cytochrome b [Sinimarinibacterium sp. NLF-5-8]QHS11313.1 cytochrome b [Sinimarinibacterium sp. NLF-5-8]